MGKEPQLTNKELASASAALDALETAFDCEFSNPREKSYRYLRILQMKSDLDIIVMQEEFAWEDYHQEQLMLYARFCPICEQDCGEPEYEGDDLSVGIRCELWINSCPQHGGFSSSSNGTTEMNEDEYRPTHC